MASKRSWQGPTSRSKPHYSKRTKQSDWTAEGNEASASSSAFQNHPTSMPELDHSTPSQSLNRSPLSRKSIASPLSTTHLSTREGALLRPLRSQSYSSQGPTLGHGKARETESDADIQRREDADAMNEIIMAIDMKNRGTLGCAFYIAREEKLCLMEDIKMAELDIVDTLKLHVQPTVILISSRAEEDLEDHLSKEARLMGRDNHGS
jgi:DNA mismatch repair protein MSH5